MLGKIITSLVFAQKGIVKIIFAKNFTTVMYLRVCNFIKQWYFAM